MAKNIRTKREREKAMVSEMIALYCKKQHGRKTVSARNVRRWMLFHHPVAAVRHVIETKKEKRKLEETK